MSENDFTSRVVASNGSWPLPPSNLSFSSLREIEQCPRRWMLRRARYPELWGEPGYPDLPRVPALMGEVIHSALETIVAALVTAGCQSSASADAVDILRTLGGYTVIIVAAIEHLRPTLEINPRVAVRAPSIIRDLSVRIPEMRRRAQAALARTRFTTRRTRSNSESVPSGGSGRLSFGSHPEVFLRAESIGWIGRADLITLGDKTCQIVDYKTGAEYEDHLEQVRVYALLWSLDGVLNPSGRPATELVLVYPDRDKVLIGPNKDDLLQIQGDIENRSRAARARLEGRPPLANPELSMCLACPVRHLCEDYWIYLREAESQIDATAAPDGFGDFELIVREQNGPRSWNCDSAHGISTSSAQQVLVFARDLQLRLDPGSTIRLLNGRFHREPEEHALTVTVGENSEIHLLV